VDLGAGHGRGQRGVAVGDHLRVEHEVRRRQPGGGQETLDAAARLDRRGAVRDRVQTAITVGTIMGRRR
jgi:hypothetical protein